MAAPICPSPLISVLFIIAIGLNFGQELGTAYQNGSSSTDDATLKEEANMTVSEEPASLNGTGGITLDFEGETPTVVRYSRSKAPTFMEMVTGFSSLDAIDIDLYSTSDHGLLRTNNTSAKNLKRIVCIPKNFTANATSQVQLVNSTSLLQKLGNKNDTNGLCTVVLFFAPWCMFCARVAPHYNALARVYPQLDVLAIDAVHFSSLNTRFGTIAVPNILVFHNSKAVARFNHSERTLENIATFVSNVTGIKPNRTLEVLSADFDEGSLPSQPSDEHDYLLWLSWVFVLVFFGTVFTKSSVGQRLIQYVQNFGVEHPQHIHVD